MRPLRAAGYGLTRDYELRQLGRRSLAMQVDISRKTEVDGLAQQVAVTFGTVDILFNNAAVNARTPGQFGVAEDELEIWM